MEGHMAGQNPILGCSSAAKWFAIGYHGHICSGLGILGHGLPSRGKMGKVATMQGREGTSRAGRTTIHPGAVVASG